MRFEEDVKKRLTRMESRLVRGFEELGVNTEQDSDWISVDDASRTVYVSTIGRSLVVLMQEMARKGATHNGEVYDVVHQGQIIAHVPFNPVFK